jgi:hypothetical protein
VQDLLSGEALFTASCNKGCVDIVLKKREIDPAFDHVMNNADSPSSSVAEPNDWQTVPATEYDAQGKPIASPQSPGTGKQDFYPDAGKPIHTPASQHKSAAPSGR